MHLANWVRVNRTARTLKAMVEFSAKGQMGKDYNADILESHDQIVPTYQARKTYHLLTQYRDDVVSGRPRSLWPMNHLVLTDCHAV